MTLIKSISGIRGTIGGSTGDTLNPLDIVKFTTAYAQFIRRSGKGTSNKIVVGRDARISGEMVKNVVCGTLMGVGYDVILLRNWQSGCRVLMVVSSLRHHITLASGMR